MSSAQPDSAATRAIFQAVVLTALADGSVPRSEADVVDEMLKLDERFAKIADAFDLAVAVRVLLDAHGIEGALEKIVANVKDAADHRTTFRLCARIIIADGKTEGEEAMVLGTLQELFALSIADVRAAFEAERKRKTQS